jgi:hypothetical protein
MIALQPRIGKLTFEAEGTEQGLFHSRVLHVPSSSSGLTIGRGYDMKKKTSTKILHDLTRVGIPAEIAKLLAGASGLYGSSATKFMDSSLPATGRNSEPKKTLKDFEISQEQQVQLFNISYQEEMADTKRICTKEDTTRKYGACNWDLLDTGIKEVLIDLKFRGDYTPDSRLFLQKSVSDNDTAEFFNLISDISRWKGVPSDRFKRRVDFFRSNMVCKNF